MKANTCPGFTPISKRWSLGLTPKLAFLLVLPLTLHADPSEIHRFLTTYCNDCHGAEKQKGDRRFDELALPASDLDTLIAIDDILEQIHLGDMRPKKSPQPTPEEREIFFEQMAGALAQARETLSSNGSSMVLRRLNRREYLNTIGDLFSLNMAAFDPTAEFPRDRPRTLVSRRIGGNVLHPRATQRPLVVRHAGGQALLLDHAEPH